MNDQAFVFDDVRISPDRQIDRHSHHQWELSHVIRGSGIRTIGDQSEPIAEGEVILIPPDIPHVWNFDSDTVDDDGCIANISVFFEPRLLDGISDLFPEMKETIDRIRLQNEAKSYSGKTLDKIVGLLYSMRGHTASHRLPSMLQLMILITDTDNCHGVGRNNVLNRSDQRLESIRTFCACNYAREISLDEIAAYAGMNKSAFCTFMKRHSGQTFSEYINNHRLARAKERIEHSDDNISDIAYAVGFGNVTYFNRLFRTRYGITPKSVRNGKIQEHNL